MPGEAGRQRIDREAGAATAGELRQLVEPDELLAAAGELDKLTVLSGVREYPMRVKCATLSWHTLMAALNKRQENVSTEGDDRL